jgi:hypothetical protein
VDPESGRKVEILLRDETPLWLAYPESHLQPEELPEVSTALKAELLRLRVTLCPNVVISDLGPERGDVEGIVTCDLIWRGHRWVEGAQMKSRKGTWINNTFTPTAKAKAKAKSKGKAKAKAKSKGKAKAKAEATKAKAKAEAKSQAKRKPKREAKAAPKRPGRPKAAAKAPARIRLTGAAAAAVAANGEEPAGQRKPKKHKSFVSWADEAHIEAVRTAKGRKQKWLGARDHLLANDGDSALAELAASYTWCQENAWMSGDLWVAASVREFINAALRGTHVLP